MSMQSAWGRRYIPYTNWVGNIQGTTQLGRRRTKKYSECECGVNSAGPGGFVCTWYLAVGSKKKAKNFKMDSNGVNSFMREFLGYQSTVF